MMIRNANEELKPKPNMCHLDRTRKKKGRGKVFKVKDRDERSRGIEILMTSSKSK
jgi:hypothetical protein